MSECRKNVFYLFLFIFLLNCIFSKIAMADAGVFNVNVDYLKSNTFSSEQKLLELKVEVQGKVKNDYPYTFQRIPKKIKFYYSPKSSETIECSFGSSFTPEPFDCGLVPISISVYADSFTYVFKIEKQNEKWLRLSTPLAGSKSLWINKMEYPEISVSGGPAMEYHEIAVRIVPLAEWVTSRDGFGIVHTSLSDELYMYAKPDVKTKPLGKCKSMKTGYVISGLIQTRKIKGDWVQVFCDGPDCFADDSPNFFYSDLVPEIKKKKAERKKLKDCLRGWIRWRSNDGHLLVYPKWREFDL